MIADAVRDAINTAWATVYGAVVGFFTLSFLDPFWHWVPLAALIIAAATAIAWFFGGLFPALRWLAGIVVLGILWGLYVFARGEQEARDFDKKKKRR
jgi:hypothetical protein